MIKLLTIFLWVFHIVTCGFWRMHKEYPNPDDWELDTTWYVLPDVRNAATVWPQYLVSLHWALSTLTGNESGPTNIQQTGYAAACLLIGLLLESAVV